MVTDFKHLGWFKNFLDDALDHKFIMDIKDPLFKEEFNYCLTHNDILSNVVKLKEGFWVPDLTQIREFLDLKGLSENESNAIFEKYEGAIFVDFVPTSENLSAWLLSVVQEKMKDLPNVRVKAVEYWETPKSHCRVES